MDFWQVVFLASLKKDWVWGVCSFQLSKVVTFFPGHPHPQLPRSQEAEGQLLLQSACLPWGLEHVCVERGLLVHSPGLTLGSPSWTSGKVSKTVIQKMPSILWAMSTRREGEGRRRLWREITCSKMLVLCSQACHGHGLMGKCVDGCSLHPNHVYL